MSGKVIIPPTSQYSAPLHELLLSMLQVEPPQRPGIQAVQDRVRGLMQSAA